MFLDNKNKKKKQNKRKENEKTVNNTAGSQSYYDLSISATYFF